MKLFITLLLASLTVHADRGLDEIGFTQITTGQYRVVNPIPKCPPNAMCAPVTVLELSLNLEGCVDKAVVSYNVVKTKTQTKVVISAINVKNPDSALVRCIVRPTSQHKIFLGAGFLNKENVKVEFLGQLAE